MTKHVSVNEEALKNPLTIEDVKVVDVPKMVDDSLTIGSSHVGRKSRRQMRSAIITPKAAVKRTSRLYKATQCLYDLEKANSPEQPLNIDLDLYQMEDY